MLELVFPSQRFEPVVEVFNDTWMLDTDDALWRDGKGRRMSLAVGHRMDLSHIER